jgi:hypothetical protein
MEVGPPESIHIRQLEVNWSFLWNRSIWILARRRLKTHGLRHMQMIDIGMGIWQESGHNFNAELQAHIYINRSNMKNMAPNFDVRKHDFSNI